MAYSTDMSEIGGFITPDGLTYYLEDLHTQLCGGMEAGEITFREIRSEGAAAANTPWARAEFADGHLQQLAFVKPTETVGGVQYVHSVLYLPQELAGRRWIQTTEHLCVNDVVSCVTTYAEPDEIDTLAGEVQAFILDAISTERYDRSPEHAPAFYAAGYPVRSWRMQQLLEKVRRAGAIGVKAFGYSSPHAMMLGVWRPEEL